MTEDADEARIRRALWGSLAAIGVAALLIAGGYVLMRPATVDERIVPAVSTGPAPWKAAADLPSIPFVDITTASGIDFTHENGAYGERLLPETMGGGVAFLDYDNDDDQDLLFVNSAAWPWHTSQGPAATSRLYRNIGDGTFEDVSERTGMDVSLYGMGVATGDYDRDGYVDVLITAVGANRLLHNVRGERFVDVTTTAGVAGDPNAWSTSAAFFDYDRDGDLDLFVANYVAWSREINAGVDYQLSGIGPAYGPPTDFAGTDSILYRNDDGRFVDVSLAAGIQVQNRTTGQPVGKGLAVMAIDVNADGWLDLAVANDTVRNFLFINETDGTFVESGIDLGFAFDNSGLATGAMGIDAAHYRNDSSLAIVIGNFANEMTSFYANSDSQSGFSDDAIVSGVGATSRRALTFGLVFTDLDLDGRLDLIAANGHVEPEINRVQSSQQYAQKPQVFWNCGQRCSRVFQPLVATGGLDQRLVGRGISAGDIDGDGDPDLVITSAGGRAVLLRNDQAQGHAWLQIDIESPIGPAIGTRVEVANSGTRQVQTVMPGRSYLSQVPLTLTFGLGPAGPDPVTVNVTWSDGAMERYSVAARMRHRLKRGAGAPIKP
jgi:hypothetical protein